MTNLAMSGREAFAGVLDQLLSMVAMLLGIVWFACTAACGEPFEHAGSANAAYLRRYSQNLRSQIGLVWIRGAENGSTEATFTLRESASHTRLPVHGAVGAVLGAAGPLEPFEEGFDERRTSAIKAVRYGLRRALRFLRWSAHRWADWILRALGFSLVALIVALFDRALIVSWKQGGWRALRHALLLGSAVYVRLLCDRHAPMVGKVAVAFAIAYGVASRDLVPDAWFPVGVLDDLLVVVLASRGFLLVCPERLVQELAVHTTRAWPRSRARPQ